MLHRLRIFFVLWCFLVAVFQSFFQNQLQPPRRCTMTKCLTLVRKLLAIPVRHPPSFAIPPVVTVLHYRKNSVYPLSGIGAWRLQKGLYAIVPRDRVIVHDWEMRNSHRLYQIQLESRYVAYKLKERKNAE